MQFNKVLGSDSTQEDVSAQVKSHIEHFIAGNNTTLFAYGQTGAGKTYTIIGDQLPFSAKTDYAQHIAQLTGQSRGILIRAIQAIFSQLHQADALYSDTTLWLSILEIYNEKAYDLLNLKDKVEDMKIHEQDGQVSVPDLSHYKITDLQEALKYVTLGLQSRVTRQNYENDKSSRSHCVFQLNLFRKSTEGEKQKSVLRIVDLAGSEKFKIQTSLTQ